MIVDPEHRVELFPNRRIEDRYDRLHATVEIAFHPVRRSEIVLCLAGVGEPVHAAVLQKTPDQPVYPNALGQALHAGT